MADLGKAYVQIIPSAEGIAGKIQKAIGGDVDKAGESSGESFGQKFASAAKKIIAAAGIGKFFNAALDEGGKLQQSYLGGLDTLYGDAADAAREYAMAAAEAGISANDYAEQAVSFGAALKSAFGGDVTKAAEAANTAIMDMADNSAKMGTDIGSVQAAYQGFAKQNYTMLDNLKLGYGGTKSEMERLLARANELNAQQGKITNYSIDNLGDVYDAIHVVQEDLGLTGVAAEEAASTLSGSFGALKASFQNLIGQMALGEDISEHLQKTVSAASNYIFGNLIPMVVNVVGSLPSTIGTLLTTGLPILFEQGMAMIESLKNGVVANIPNVISQALPMILEFVQTMRSDFGQMVDAGIDLILNIVDGLVAALPDMIAYVPEIITNICGVINDNMPKIFGMGIEIIAKLITGLIDNLPNLLANMGDIMMAAWNVVTAINWLSLGSQVLKALVNGVKSLASSLPSALKNIAQNGWNVIKGINWAGVGSAIIKGIVSGLTAFGGMIKNTLMGLAEKAWNGLKDFFGIASPSKLMRDTIGRYIPEGMAVGIEANADEVYDAMNNLSNGTVAAYSPQIEPASSAGIAMTDFVSELHSLKDAILGMQIVLDSGALVGEMSPALDYELGRINTYRGRGN